MRVFLVCLVAGTISAKPASAGMIELFDYGINIDGAVSTSFDPLPSSVDASAFDFTTGIGQWTVTFSAGAPGSHFVVGFFDHQIDESINTFFNEFGQSSGSPEAGQTWEIDEPGFLFGDIYDNFLANTLDGSNAVPSGFEDDVSIAMGWFFQLTNTESAVVTFDVSTTEPGGFHLQHLDAESPDILYLSSSLDIEDSQASPPAVPEPSSIVLWLIGAGLLLRRTVRNKFSREFSSSPV